MSNELNIGNLPFQYEPTNFYKQSLPPIRNDVSKTKSFQKNERLPISEKVTVKSIAGENPQELQKRLLLEAASRAGLDGTEEQKQFVNRYLTGISFVNAADDPSKNDDTKIKSADLKGEYFNYRLSKDEIESLRELQKSYQQNGGKLHAGKTYDNSTSGRTLTAAEMRSGKHGMTAEQFERWNTQEEYRKAHILPTAFSTPSKLNDLKHVVIDVPADVKADDADGVLRSYIEQRYGGGNLWGDKKADILQLAKQSGVKLENISVSGGKAEFNISVGSLLKLHQAYISVQENFNAAEKIAQTAQDKMALNQFLIGVGEGAWADLKSNYKMVRHPVETINNIREAVSALSNLSKDDLLKIYESLKAQGKSFIFEKDISEVSRDVGKVVGAALVEFALFKGIGAGLKALQGLTTTAGFLQKANQLKQTIGKLPIPTAAIKIVDFGNGLKMPMATGELKKLEDIINLMKSSDESLQMLKGGSTAGREVLTEVAEKGLTETAQSGLKSLRGLISKEGLQKAKEQLVTLNVARTELIGRLDKLAASSNLLSDTKTALTKAKNSLSKHLKQDDLVGALRDVFGKDVRRAGDGYIYQHLTEVNNALKSLDNAKNKMIMELGKMAKGTQEYSKMSQEIDAVKELISRANAFVEIK